MKPGTFTVDTPTQADMLKGHAAESRCVTHDDHQPSVIVRKISNETDVTDVLRCDCGKLMWTRRVSIDPSAGLVVLTPDERELEYERIALAGDFENMTGEALMALVEVTLRDTPADKRKELYKALWHAFVPIANKFVPVPDEKT